MQVEICSNSVQSAVNARQGGATRVELCQDLAGGGTTPSAAAIDYCVHSLALQTRVLIRPRLGNFCYNEIEYQVMLNEVQQCKRLGAHAVVVGFLTNEGEIDMTRTSEVVRLAAPMEVTFHRAFDECSHPIEALEQIIACGCHKLLTSGCAPSALEGVDMLRRLVEQSKGRISIIAAAGVTPSNVRHIIERSGVTEVHGSCKHTVLDWSETDAEQVRALCMEAASANPSAFLSAKKSEVH